MRNKGSREGGKYFVLFGDRGDRGIFVVCTGSFSVKIFFPFPLVTAKLIGDYFDKEG